MIAGTIVLEDHTITFSQVPAPGSCVIGEHTSHIEFVVFDTVEQQLERRVVPQDKFFKALSIAVHNDGAPDYNKDYPDAESIMGDIRWIP